MTYRQHCCPSLDSHIATQCKPQWHTDKCCPSLDSHIATQCKPQWHTNNIVVHHLTVTLLHNANHSDIQTTLLSITWQSHCYTTQTTVTYRQVLSITWQSHCYTTQTTVTYRQHCCPLLDSDIATQRKPQWHTDNTVVHYLTVTLLHNANHSDIQTSVVHHLTVTLLHNANHSDIQATLLSITWQWHCYTTQTTVTYRQVLSITWQSHCYIMQTTVTYRQHCCPSLDSHIATLCKPQWHTDSIVVHHVTVPQLHDAHHSDIQTTLLSIILLSNCYTTHIILIDNIAVHLSTGQLLQSAHHSDINRAWLSIISLSHCCAVHITMTDTNINWLFNTLHTTVTDCFTAKQCTPHRQTVLLLITAHHTYRMCDC